MNPRNPQPPDPAQVADALGRYRRGHGARYAALAGRAIDEEKLAGLPAGDAAQVPEACARWARLRFAIDGTYPPPDAECSPERGHHASRQLILQRHFVEVSLE